MIIKLKNMNYNLTFFKKNKYHKKYYQNTSFEMERMNKINQEIEYKKLENDSFQKIIN